MSGGECAGCRHMRELGRERDKGPLGVYTVSFWCDLRGRHTSPSRTCPEHAAGGVPEVCRAAPSAAGPRGARKPSGSRGNAGAAPAAREKNK